MSFSGFSEDDIRKLSDPQLLDHTRPHEGPQITSVKKAIRKPNHNKIKKATHKRISKFDNNSIARNSENNILEENAKLDISPPKKSEIIEESSKLTVLEDSSEDIDCKNNNLTEDTKESFAGTFENLRLIREPRFIDLDEFEHKQKLIEEQNRKRKELLAKALADRTKRTQEEAQRLNEIHEEFQKLDASLSNDVKILRKHIEVASVEYMECQKKYHKIEKEFVEAKSQLHQKLEKKEMLKEHLCAIIEKNEERKAEKLNDLLQKLQVVPLESLEADAPANNNGTVNPN